MRAKDWVTLAIATITLCCIIWMIYEFITHIQPGALDCTITWGRKC